MCHFMAMTANISRHVADTKPLVTLLQYSEKNFLPSLLKMTCCEKHTLSVQSIF